MCDYSLHNVKSRPAKVGDKLITRDFGTGTRGFAVSEDRNIAVCLVPGTELSFADEVACKSLWPWKNKIGHTTAIFRQVNLDKRRAHHDALEFPDGRIVLLTFLKERQQATVLQLPAAGVGSTALGQFCEDLAQCAENFVTLCGPFSDLTAGFRFVSLGEASFERSVVAGKLILDLYNRLLHARHSTTKINNSGSLPCHGWIFIAQIITKRRYQMLLFCPRLRSVFATSS